MTPRATLRIVMATAGAIAGCGIGVVGMLDARDTPDPAAADGAVTDGGAAGDEGTTTTCVADLASDPANCGACGHDCSGGACTGGRCQPVDLVTDGSDETVRAVAVDATHLYWSNTSDGRIYRANKDGTSRTELVGSGATQLAVNATHLFYTSGGLHRFELASGNDAVIAAGVYACIGLDPDGMLLYGITGGDVIVEMKLDGSGRRDLLTAADGVWKPWGVAATPTHWYWSGGLNGEPDGSILRRQRPSGPTSAVHLHQRNPNCLTFGDDGRLYWPNADQGTIHSSEPDGSDLQTLASGQVVTTQIAIDAKHLYWNSGNKVVRLAR